MTRLRDISIYTKFIFVLLAMLLTLSLAFSIILWDGLSTNLGEQLDKHGLEIAGNLASLAATPMLQGNTYTLFELINETHKHNEDVRYIFMTDHHNRLLVHTFATGFPQGLLSVNQGRAGIPYSVVRMNTNEDVVRDIMLPVENGMVGFIHVGITEKAMRQQLSALLKRMIIITLVICIFATLLAARIARSITKPLRRLADYTEQLSQGLAVKVAITGADEVGRLGVAFRQMASILQKANKERETLITELTQKEYMRKILLGKVLTAQEDERKQLSRELHDGAGQALTSLMVSMRVLADRAADPAEKELLLNARELAATTLKDIRTMAVELRPPAIDDFGLVPAVQKYISDFRKIHNIAINLVVPTMGTRVNSQTATALYRIIQESLTNVIKHSGAKEVTIILEINSHYIVLSVTDDGQGFEPSVLVKARHENRLGLYGMMERAQLLGGTVEYLSTPEQGATVRVIVPNLEEDEHVSENH